MSSPEFRELLIFQVGNETLALSMDVVEEVLEESPITPIPGTAKFVKGLAAVRGKITSVIDGAMRLGIASPGPRHFMICRVRGNQTAVTIARPVEAGNLRVQKLSDAETEQRVRARKINPRLITTGWRLFTAGEREGDWQPTDRIVLEVSADQFVSDQMASQLKHA